MKKPRGKISILFLCEVNHFQPACFDSPETLRLAAVIDAGGSVDKKRKQGRRREMSTTLTLGASNLSAKVKTNDGKSDPHKSLVICLFSKVPGGNTIKTTYPTN